MTKEFAELLKKNGLRHIRLHDLRHSCASNMLASGVQMKEIQEWLGHSNFSTTADVYSHLDFIRLRQRREIRCNARFAAAKARTYESVCRRHKGNAGSWNRAFGRLHYLQGNGNIKKTARPNVTNSPENRGCITIYND